MLLRFGNAFAILALVAFSAGCAKVQAYHPAPVAPIASAHRIESRSLTDPGLRRYMEKALGHPLAHWPPRTWNLNRITLAAYYFSPRIEVARAAVALAQAGVVTAGERPNPTISLSPGVPSPYLFGLSFLFPIQTAGKRGYRIARAKALTSMARMGVASTAWMVRAAVRQAFVNALLAARNVQLVRTEQQLRRHRVRLLRARFQAGEMARGPVEAASIQLTDARLALSTAEGRVTETRAALAGAVGIPVSGLKGAKFSWPTFARPPAVASLSPARIQRAAVLNRIDVRRSLLSYAETEAALQLEISRQYPNFNIGPGYQFEEGHNYFTVGFSATLPIFNRNQGPIAQAEARRKQAAAQFLATQARVIAQSEQALARYRAAFEELNQAEHSLNRLQRVQVRLVLHSFQAGESGRLSLNQVHLESVTAAETVLGALGRAQTALGSLESAVQRPLGPGERSFLPVVKGKGSTHPAPNTTSTVLRKGKDESR